MKYEVHPPFFSGDNHPERVPGPLGIGQPNLSYEITIGGKRLLGWHLGEYDKTLQDVAGWAPIFRDESPERGIAYIEVPEGTRSAASVLSGLEAWDGEKSDVLKFIADYHRKVRTEFGATDMSVGLGSVAVTKEGTQEERQMFIVPPHHLSDGETNAINWEESIIADVRLVLRDEPTRDQLLGEFIEGLMATDEGAR